MGVIKSAIGNRRRRVDRDVGVLRVNSWGADLGHSVRARGSGFGDALDHHRPRLPPGFRVRHNRRRLGRGQLQPHRHRRFLSRRPQRRFPNLHGSPFSCSGAAGAVGGAIAIGEVIPVQYKDMLGGPSLKVDLHTGAMAEGVLTFTITFAILLIVIKGPRSPVLKTWLVSMATVALVVTGSSYTGPAMNPANAFSWAYINNWYNTWDQLSVYWICPFIGAILSASVFRILFPIPAKQKKA